MRLFLAVEVVEDIRRKIGEVINEIKELNADVKFTKIENLHYTLKFLGEVYEQHVNGIEKIIIDTIRNKPIKPFDLSIQGFGFFGNSSHIRAIWIDSEQGHEELVKLAKAMNEALNHIRRDDREPKPHLTVGRVRSDKNNEKLLEKIKLLTNVKFGYMHVKQIKLKQSVLSTEGPYYTDLKAFELA